MNERYDFVDNMRAIGIVLVVLGHAPGLGITLLQSIYGFHMPLFFFISGFLLRSKKLSMGIGDYLTTLWNSLVLPYLFFVIVSYLYWLPTHTAASKAAEYSELAWYEPLSRLFIGYGHVANIGLWFFTCLTVTSLAYYLFRRYFSEKATLFVIAVSSFCFIFLHQESWPRLPWCVDIAVVALLFYSIGHYVSEHGRRFLLAHSKMKCFAIALAAMALSVVLATINGRVGLLDLNFGKNPVLFVPTAIAGIISVLFVSMVWNANAVSRWLSLNTIIIFPVHALMFSVFTGIAVILFKLPHNFKDSSEIYGLMYTVLALVLSYPTALVLYRLFPFVFGKRAQTIPNAAVRGRPSQT